MADFRLRFRRRKPPESLGATLSLALTALKESADAFPPLKGAVGAVVHIRDLRLKVKSNQDEFNKLVSRVEMILEKVADAVPDPTKIPPDLQGRIEEFTTVVAHIGHLMESRSRRKALRRLLSHKEDEEIISDIHRRLDNLESGFTNVSVIKLEIAVATLAKDQESRLDQLIRIEDGARQDVHKVMQQIDDLRTQVVLTVLFDATPLIMPTP